MKYEIENLFKITFYAFALVAVMYGLGILISQGIDKDIARQCAVLQDQSRQYSEAGFYITQSEKTMCDGIGQTIDAPVK